MKSARTTLKFKIVAVLLVILSIPVIFIGGPIAWFMWTFPPNRYGYVDNKGHFVISPQYMYGEDFKNGKVKVSTLSYDKHNCPFSEKYVLNRAGETVSYKRTADWCGFYPSGRSAESSFSLYSREESDPYPAPTFDEKKGNSGRSKYGYKNKNGTWLIPPHFLEANNFYNNVAWVQEYEGDEHNWGLINKKGDYILQPKCSIAGNFYDGLALCRVKVRYGFFY